jgi:DNA-binding CsgD family transcriptional regulator
MSARNGRAAVRARLDAALDDVAGNDLASSLEEVARALAVAGGVETVAIRLRATDGDDRFHLVAIEGSTPEETRRRALEATPISVVKSLVALGAGHSSARGFGLRWMRAYWLRDASGAIGVLYTGSRTDRRPSAAEEKHLAGTAARLGSRLASADRSTDNLVRISRRIARLAVAEPTSTENPALEALRPRERSVLELYAEGLSADEIARLLYISPHTVRTHVKNSFRRLRIHSRDEAARVVHRDDVARVL